MSTYNKTKNQGNQRSARGLKSNSLTSASKGRTGSEIREIEPIHEEVKDDLEDDDDI